MGIVVFGFLVLTCSINFIVTSFNVTVIFWGEWSGLKQENIQIISDDDNKIGQLQ